mgnify:CR=1 FL=1
MNLRAEYGIPLSALTKALFFFSYALLPVVLFSQNCQIPILNSISSITDVSVQLEWDDTNTQVDTWEIEFGERGFTRSFIANVAGLTTTRYTLDGLSPGSSYELYLRAQCPNQIYSAWNGPYFFSTAIRNNGECGLNLTLGDNNCPQGEHFNILVDAFNDLYIGDDVEFKSVSIIVEHSWPPDLQISLQSPSGSLCRLFQQSGNGKSNLGDPLSPNCENSLVFNPFSCSKLQNPTGDLTGEFIPLENFQELFAGEPVNGTWSLVICDTAESDVGVLRHVELEFGEVSCTRPKDFHIRDIEATTVKLDWIESNNCDRIKFLYRRKVDPPALSVVEYEECFRKEFIITGLEPSTEYILDVSSVCMSGLESELICTQEFTTACANSILSESFDALNLCNLSCRDTCFTGPIWQNKNDIKLSSWKVSTGETPTALTGPAGDIAELGKYIYTEASLECIQTQDTMGILMSPCLKIIDDSSCHLSFYYNMNIDSSAQLQLQLNIGAGTWFTFWTAPSLRSVEWQYVQLDLPPITDHFEMRFLAMRYAGSQRADMALDHIKLIALDSVPLSKYFPDLDQDGYGSGNPQYFCSTSIPPFFSSLNGDCDDNNPLVNPSSPEIPCNFIDDNCNGMGDDLASVELGYFISAVTVPSCIGANDASIELVADGDNEPFTYLWNTGSTSGNSNGLSDGIYVCTITDAQGCQVVTEEISISGPQVLSYSVSVTPESCRGASDASIELFISGGSEEYIVSWSNGKTGQRLESLNAGFYQASISDFNSCLLVTDSIELTAQSNINADVILKRDLDCFGETTGIAQVAAFGGQGPYTYNWSNGTSGNLLSNAPAGVYSVSIIDANNCQEVIETIILNQAEEINVSVVQIENISCAGAENGSIQIEVSGGVEPYDFSWSDGTNAKDLISVPAGLYNLTLTDANACTAVLENLLVSENDVLDINIISIENIRCQDSSGGSIDLEISGGVPPYRYNWSHLSEIKPGLDKIEMLEAGIYALTVSDFLGCKSKIEGIPVIVENEQVNVSIILEGIPSCFGFDDASLIAVSNNGIMPLDFNWSSGKKLVKNMRSDTLPALSSGIYNLTITDAEGCVGISDSITITDPELLEYRSISISNNPCFGFYEGSVDILAFGGTEPIEVQWNNGHIGSTIPMLPNGEYFATVSDANNCIIETETFVITSPTALNLELDVRDADEALGGQITAHVTGGLLPYSYEWSPDDKGLFLDSLAQNLEQGEYLLSIRDANGCSIDSLIIIDFVSSTSESVSEMLEIFPNPTAHFVEWNKLPNSMKDANLILYGKDGKSIIKMKLSQLKESKLDLRQLNLRSGIYVLSFESDTFRVLKRIVFFE